jgi:glycosyltransferase involved in cell wall biosynthesis
MKVPVSVVIPTLNEAANLARCLASVTWAHEIFVVDSKSADGTARIARDFGAKVVNFEWNGQWPKKKNWALENLKFSHEWVFILDADEVLPPEAEQEFREICTRNPKGFDGYWINRRFFFMGKCLKHAYFPNWNLRLFKHRLGRYEKLTKDFTFSGDNEIHEHILFEGKTGRLKSIMDHYAFPSVEVFVEKHNRYSNWEARIHRWHHWLPFRPFLRFLYVYFIQMGFLDGKEGYYFAKLHGFYEFLSVCKRYELRRKP